ncbi:3-isopropylmalate dehydratase large subunit [Thalassococcus sp. S3]|uniref:3-isopropylmalate dehydratase large subunit n=1 Tax=Thalassococcus sp. S3 TaxID=2017482 RepID=UPI0010247EE1|nr:3-isopropylmalate dehydratase large subunit [Thalassococcus sp. S3]QBF33959.1 3-isopropylmalate dehydratase [Thalassococcus sp. S3]
MSKRTTTLYDKLLAQHEVRRDEGGASLVLIDRIMLHERTGSIALSNLAEDGREIVAPETVFSTIDHIADTRPGRPRETRMPGGEVFIEAMRAQTRKAGLKLFDINDPRQGIVHVIAPELGIALPGITLVCPDSHTCTLGALGALAWGIGSTDAEHALATQTLRVPRKKQMRIWLDGRLPEWSTAKDVILALIAKYSAGHAVGHVIEFAGPAVEAMEIEARLTLCNMGVEFGAFTAVIAPDEKTIDYIAGRHYGPAPHMLEAAKTHWRSLKTDQGADFDSEIVFDVSTLAPMVSWGTSPEQTVGVDGTVPTGGDGKALGYMGLAGGQALLGLPVDTAFIGSCTNSRLSDLRRAAAVLRGRRVAEGVLAICVPGSTATKEAAEAEGLDQIFKAAGFQWRESGCSMCFYAGGEGFGGRERVISSTNRNFEGRQGPRARTHIASPETVAWSAVQGQIADVRDLQASQRRAS